LTVIGALADQPLLHQLADHRRHAAGLMEVLAQIFAGGLQIDQQRHGVADRLPVLIGRSTPEWRARAVRWIGALVEPPMAELTTMALWKASGVRMSDGFRSSCTISTIRRPVL
jgi:hypothetical protein